MLRYTVNILIYLSLALLIGGIVFFGAGVASVLFQEGVLPNRTIAGAVNSLILQRLGMLELSAAAVLVGGTLYAAFRYKAWMNWGALLVAATMLATITYYTTVTFPTMNTLREAIGDFDAISAEKAGLKAEFDAGHSLYSTMTKGVLFGGVLVLVLHTVGLVRYVPRRKKKGKKTKGNEVPHNKPTQPHTIAATDIPTETPINSANAAQRVGIESKEK